MVVMSAGKFLMGEQAVQKEVRIANRFAVG